MMQRKHDTDLSIVQMNVYNNSGVWERNVGKTASPHHIRGCRPLSVTRRLCEGTFARSPSIAAIWTGILRGCKSDVAAWSV